MHRLVAPFVVAISAASLLAAEPGKVVRKAFSVGNAERGYFLYEPPDRRPDERLPLIITLHGSGGDARMLVDAWKNIASRERVVLMGPQALSGGGWDVGVDSPELFRALVDLAVAEYGVDNRRVHLFGFSAGGHFALLLAVLEPEFFASAAVYAGALMPELNDAAAAAERRIPITLIGGRRDTIVAPPYMEDTRDRLTARGWQPQLHMLDIDHNYRRLPGQINALAWTLFRDARLEQDPKFKQYRF